MPGPRDISQAARALESTLVKQLLESSGAFRGSEAAGGQMHSQMFMEVLADAVSKDDSLGIGKMIEKSLQPPGAHGSSGADGSKGSKELNSGLLLEHHLHDLMPKALPMPPGQATPHPLKHDLQPLHKLPGFDSIAPNAPTLSQLLPESPATGPVVTSPYGERVHPIDGVEKFHTGVDLRAAEGTPILAAAGGVVKSAGNRGGYGNAVEIDHGNGMTTLYAHASALEVHPGETIAEGQELGRVGATGRATGPHLHFEVRVDGRPVDPKKALNAYAARAESPIEESREPASKGQ